MTEPTQVLPTDKLIFEAAFIEKLLNFVGSLPSSQSAEIFTEFKRNTQLAISDLIKTRTSDISKEPEQP
jgi:hypothetical protein